MPPVLLFSARRAEGALELPVDPTPRVSERQAWLDAIDRATGGRFPVRIRNPRGRAATFATPRGEQAAFSVYDAAKDELVVTVPNLGGWQIATVFL